MGSARAATPDGGTDVTQVIAAIDWVVQHRHDNGMNIRVLNLSYGNNTMQDAGRIDGRALAAAQQSRRAWNCGSWTGVSWSGSSRSGSGWNSSVWSTARWG